MASDTEVSLATGTVEGGVTGTYLSPTLFLVHSQLFVVDVSRLEGVVRQPEGLLLGGGSLLLAFPLLASLIFLLGFLRQPFRSC